MDKINKIKIKDVTYEIGGGGSATVDSGLSTTSENAVQNKVITSELGKKIDKSGFTTTNKEVIARYNHFGGIYEFDDRILLHVQSQYTGSTFTAEIASNKPLCKLVNYKGYVGLAQCATNLYALFKAKDLGRLKSDFTIGKANKFTAYVCNTPSDGDNTHTLYTIYQDLGYGNSMQGKEYVMTMRKDDNYSGDNILNYASPTKITNATFESLYATYSGDTSTMFFAPWKEIRNAFVTTDHSWYINQGSGYKNIYVYSSSKVSDYTEGIGYYVKFIELNDFTDNGVGNSMELQANVDKLWGGTDLVSMKTDIASNKTKIDSLETKVVYAEPDSASTAHTFTKTINGEKLYTTDNANRDIKLVTSVNGKTGAVNIQAKTINGESVLGEGEIDMSSYQTKTEAVKIARLTQAEYDALSTKDNNTLYIITDAQ